jgi:hypothetical protein
LDGEINEKRAGHNHHFPVNDHTIQSDLYLTENGRGVAPSIPFRVINSREFIHHLRSQPYIAAKKREFSIAIRIISAIPLRQAARNDTLWAFKGGGILQESQIILITGGHGRTAGI